MSAATAAAEQSITLPAGDMERLACMAMQLRDALAIVANEIDRAELFGGDPGPRLRAWADALAPLVESAEAIYVDLDDLSVTAA